MIRKLAFAFALLLVSATPTLGLSPSSFGSVGLCRMVTVAPNEAKLVKLAVTPPTEFTSEAGRMGGWRFLVTRENIAKNRRVITYRSPIQKDRANAAGEFSFTRMRTDVSVPDWTSAENLRDWPYRVIVKVIEYRNDGTVRWSTKAGVYDYRLYIDGQYAGPASAFCWGRTRGSEF